MAAPRVTPSGLPVPRYVSLKFAEVNARGGPGDDYKLMWVYRAKGLPLQVVAETYDWRRVCGPDGSLAWVHRRTVDARRMAMNTHTAPLPLRRRADLKSQTIAYLAPKSLASLDECKDGWCRLSAGGAKGWAREDQIWGAAETQQCRPPRAVPKR